MLSDDAPSCRFVPGFGPPTPLFLTPSTGIETFSTGADTATSLDSEIDSVETGDTFGGIGVEAGEDAFETETFRADGSCGYSASCIGVNLSVMILDGFDLEPLVPVIGGETLDDEVADDMIWDEDQKW